MKRLHRKKYLLLAAGLAVLIGASAYAYMRLASPASTIEETRTAVMAGLKARFPDMRVTNLDRWWPADYGAPQKVPGYNFMVSTHALPVLMIEPSGYDGQGAEVHGYIVDLLTKGGFVRSGNDDVYAVSTLTRKDQTCRV